MHECDGQTDGQTDTEQRPVPLLPRCALRHAVKVLSARLRRAQYIFSGFLFGRGCHGQVGGTGFEVGMTGADQRRYCGLMNNVISA